MVATTLTAAPLPAASPTAALPSPSPTAALPVPPLLDLVAPIAALAPSGWQGGASAGLPAPCAPLLQEAVRLAVSALVGEAGSAMSSCLTQVQAALPVLDSVGRDLDSCAAEAAAAISAAGSDICGITHSCVHAVLASLGSTPVLALAPAALAGVGAIVCEHLARAQARLQSLSAELSAIAARVAAILTAVPADLLPASPHTASPQTDSPPTGSPPAASAPTAAAEAMPASAMSATEPPPEASGAAPTPQAAAAVEAARQALGTPYQWGGNTPGVGLDCSGLTQWAYAQAGIDIPRTADAQAVGRAVSAQELAAGDLVVWDGHVAMMVDNATMIEAGDPVSYSPLRTDNMGMAFKGFFRPTG